MDYKDKEICQRIEEVMREKGITKSELAVQVSIAQPTVSAVLNLKRSPMALINKMCEKYGLNKTWLLTGGGSKYNTNSTPLNIDITSNKLSLEERARILNDVNQLYKRHQDLLAEASDIMLQIVELNKKLLLNE